MGRRGPLIVVSNRGPVGFRRGPGRRDRDGTRSRRARHRARTARRPPRRDVGRERDGRRRSRGRSRRFTHGAIAVGLAVLAAPRRPRRRRLPAVLRRDRKPGAVVRPARAVGSEGGSGRRSRPGLASGIRRGQPGARGRDGRGARSRPRCAHLRPRLPPLPRPALVRAARPDARIAHFTHIPWVAPAAWASSRRRSLGRSTRGSSRATASASTPSAGAPRSSQLRGAARSRRTDAERVSHANPIAVDAERVRRARRRATGSCRRAELSTSGRRSSSSASIARIRRRTPSAGSRRRAAARARARAPRPRSASLALLDPSREEIPEYVDYRDCDRARGRGRQRRGSAARLGSPSRSSSETTSRPRSPRTSSTTSCS